MEPLFTPDELAAAKSKAELPLRCLQCRRVFQLSKIRIQQALRPNQKEHRADFCSLSCAATNRNPPVEIACDQCGSIMLRSPGEVNKFRTHFCGHSCAASYWNTHKSTGTRVSKLERWLQVQLTQTYPDLVFHFNRTDAINGELDIYLPHLKLAFELNGIFHYEPIYGPEKLTSIRNNDQRKFQACLDLSIELCILDTSRMLKFKEKGAAKYLEVIRQVIGMKLEREKGLEPST